VASHDREGDAFGRSYAAMCTPSAPAVAREQRERVERAFAQLAAGHCEMMPLVRIAGLSFEEVGASAARRRQCAVVGRGLARLGKLLRERGASARSLRCRRDSRTRSLIETRLSP
jgi:hypothetical protein